MQKRITIRFVLPRGNAAPAFDGTAARHDVLALLEPHIHERFGEDTEVELTEGATNDIRVDGSFTEKASEVKAFVSEVLGNAMEDFDPSGYA